MQCQGVQCQYGYLYLNSVTDCEVSERAVSMNALKDPGLSGMEVASMASLNAPMSASSETSRSRSKFMFAPLVMTTTVLSCRESCEHSAN